MLPPKKIRRTKGQSDHLDAWLISYADLITLLFMLFVIMVSVTVSKRDRSTIITTGDGEYAATRIQSGTISMGTPYDEAYHNLIGIVTSNHADQNIAVEKSNHGLWLDVSAAQFFEEGTANIPGDQMPLIKSIARVLKASATGNYVIEVEGHTDDVPLQNSPYADNWDLAAVRATHIVNALINEGLDPSHLRATSYAGSRPLVPNVDIAGHPILQNRNRNQRMVIRLSQAPVIN